MKSIAMRADGLCVRTLQDRSESLNGNTQSDDEIPTFLRADAGMSRDAADLDSFDRSLLVCLRTADGHSVFGIPGAFSVVGQKREELPRQLLPRYELPDHGKTWRGWLMQRLVDRLHRAGD